MGICWKYGGPAGRVSSTTEFNMRWFKFYGQDYLTDTKIISMDPILRTIWVTLLCLSDENGEIKNIREWDLIKMSGCDDDQMNDPSDYDRAKGCLDYFVESEMIELKEHKTNLVTSVTTPRYDVVLLNYTKRQNDNLTNAERQQRFRERHKTIKVENKAKKDSNAGVRYESNARIEENRIDKNRLDKSISIPTPQITEQDLQDISSKYKIPLNIVELAKEEMFNWLSAKGKTYKDYKAGLRNWVLRDAKKLMEGRVNEKSRVSIDVTKL
jgi:hypothetical protein